MVTRAAVMESIASDIMMAHTRNQGHCYVHLHALRHAPAACVSGG